MALGKTVAQVTLPTLLWKWSSLLGLPLKGEDVELIRGGFQLGKWGYPNNGWLLLGEIPLKWMIYDDLGVPHLWKPPYTINGWYKPFQKQLVHGIVSPKMLAPMEHPRLAAQWKRTSSLAFMENHPHNWWTPKQ